MAVFSLEDLKEALGKDVDEAFLLANKIKELQKEHIEPLETKLAALKSKIERNMKDESIELIQGSEGRAKWVTANRSSLDIEGLCAEKGITEAEKEQFTKRTKSKYIKISKRNG